MNYDIPSDSSSVEISYNYDILTKSGNKKYAKNEDGKRIKLIGVKITNNGPLPITFSDKVSIKSNGFAIHPLRSEYLIKNLKQQPLVYLFYFLAFGWVEKCENEDCKTIPIPFGVPIGVGNMLLANSANKKFIEDIRNNNIYMRSIYPGETLKGLIGLHLSDYNSLRMEIKN